MCCVQNSLLSRKWKRRIDLLCRLLSISVVLGFFLNIRKLLETGRRFVAHAAVLGVAIRIEEQDCRIDIWSYLRLVV